MKKYIAPEMKTLAFVAEETIAASSPKSRATETGSNIFNDAEFGQW